MNDWSTRDYPTPESSLSPPVIKTENRSPPSNPNSHLESPSLPRLDLVGFSDGAQSVEKKRITPCEQCRKVRRACKWREGEARKRCERCTEAGIACSGPTRRSNSTKTTTSLESSSSSTTVALLPSSRKQGRSREASIGPSSSESRWSTLHMSYSLTYHLVETGLSYASSGFMYPGFDYELFTRRLQASRGRLEELDPIDELFALAHITSGVQCTNHSAILRLPMTVPAFETLWTQPNRTSEWTGIGLARHEPILTLVRRVARRINEESLESRDHERASQQIAVFLFGINSITDLYEVEADRAVLLRTLIRRAFYYLDQFEQLEASGEVFLTTFRELVLEEIHLSLILGAESSVSPGQYHALFGPQHPPPIPSVPPDLSFIFSGPPEAADIREAAFDFQQRWTHLAHPIYQHLEYLLAYTSSSSLGKVLRHCSDVIERLMACFETCFDRILSDPRYSPDDSRIRPGRCLNNLVHVEHGILFMLNAYHGAVRRTRNFPLERFVETSQRLWSKALNRSSHRLTLLPHCTRSSAELYATCSSLVEGLRLCPDAILLRWAQQFPGRKFEMIDGLRFVSYGMPDACRLIRKLESYVTKEI